MSSRRPKALIAALAEDARRRAAEAGAGPAASAEAGAARWPEVDPEQLLDYLEGGLPAEEAAELERRLVADPAAARALADLQDFVAAESATPAADAPADLAERAGWRDLQARLGRERRRGGGRGPWLPALAAAASLAAAVLGFRVVTLQQELERPFAVAANRELIADQRSGDDPTPIELAAGEWVELAVVPAERCATYRWRIEGVEPGGSSFEGSTRSVDPGPGGVAGLVRLVWRSPEPGLYRLVLSGCEPGQDLQEHALRVQRPPPPGGAEDGG